MIDEGVITVEYCPTNKMLSDLFTKNLNHVLFNKFANFVTGYNTDTTFLPCATRFPQRNTLC